MWTTHPFPFSQRDDALTDMLPWGQVSSNDVQVECREYSPECAQIALPTFEQSNGWNRKHSLSSKIALGQLPVFPLSLQVNSQ